VIKGEYKMSINDVMTTKEVAIYLNIDDSTIRKRIAKGLYDKNKYRKAKGGSGGTYIFDRSYIESLKK
jgi:predicted transcriptional regulator